MRTTRRHGTPAKAPAVRRRRPGIVAAAVLVGLLGSGGFVWHSTEAAFTATTATPSNSWTTGSVTISDDDAGVALFTTATNLKPADTGTKCIKVTYSGTLTPSGIKFYASALADSAPSLAAYLDMVIDVSADNGVGDFSSCGSFSGTNLYTGTLANLRTTNSAYASGLGTWTPTGGVTTTRTFRIKYTLNASAPDTVQGKTASATFTWEANS
ncbi:MAG: TasA family protein [Kineosporiaceae bacterium]